MNVLWQTSMMDELRTLARAFEIDRARLDVDALSAAAFTGRRVGTAGHEAAQQWLAERMRALGLDTAIAPFTVDIPVLDLSATPTMLVSDDMGQERGTRSLDHRRDFTVHPRSAEARAPIMGVARPFTGAFDDASVWRGAWLMLDAIPQGQALATLATEAAQVGVMGLLAPQFATAEGYLVKRIVGPTPIGLPMVAVRADLLPTLAGKYVVANTPIRAAYPAGAHVVGAIAGSDPQFADAPLLVSAHYDGVGDDGDPISDEQRLPCATDNAAGVAVVLEVARVLSVRSAPGARPRRPVLFVAVDAEEVNATGSKAYAAALKAQGMRPLALNLDGAARVHEAVWVEAGVGAQPLLHALDMAGEALEIPLVLGQVSSDNRRFAAAGFPAVGLSVGLAGLHTPADRPERVESEALRRAGALMLATAWQLAYVV